MSDIRKHITNFVSALEDKFDAFRFKIRKRFGSNDPLHIITYRSYGTRDRLYIKGRLLHDKPIEKSSVSDSLLDNILKMYQRFESDEVPGARLSVTFQHKKHIVTTDHEGYFVLHLQPEQPLVADRSWYKVDIALEEAPWQHNEPVKAEAEVLIPEADAEYGVISDIDDTIVKTTATSWLAMSRNTFLNNAHTRLPFAGVSEFYKALQSGRNGKSNNPFFYVSSSPWNLYDLLIDFLDINDIPHGPLLLRDFGLEKNKQDASHTGHKFKEIEQILVTYPHLSFVLIGDSGQEDPKIYTEVVRKFPGRILAIYIRDVQVPDRTKIAVDLAENLSMDKVEMVIVNNTAEASEHALKAGLIQSETLPAIENDTKQDKGELPGKESLG